MPGAGFPGPQGRQTGLVSPPSTLDLHGPRLQDADLVDRKPRLVPLSRGLALAGRVTRRLLGRPPADKPVPQGPVTVRFEGHPPLTVTGGQTLLAAAMQGDLGLPHYCGGMCSCGTCRILVVEGAENLSRPRGNEEMVLGAERAQRGERLACQARVLGPVRIRIPAWF